ncbi:MAG: amidohydrolase family protein [Marinicella sp.]
MKIKTKLTALAALTLCQFSQATQIPTAVVNGNIDERNSLIALQHATVHINPTKTLSNATVLIKNDRIVDIQTSEKLPEKVLKKDYTGMHIYPGFIHLDASIGLPEPSQKPPFQWGKAETINSTLKGAYNSNEAIKASFDAAGVYNTDAKANAEFRAAGFTSALSHNKDGIMRGTSVLTHLADQPAELNIIKRKASQHFSFNKGSSKQDYPVSLMGAVALIRQTFMDADWYAKQSNMTDLDLAAFNENKDLPKIFTTSNWQQTLLVQKIADEFGDQFVIKTNADSFENLEAIAATKQTLIVPLIKPDTPAINDELDAWNIEYTDLKKWEVAPYNPALLEKNGMKFALTLGDDPKSLKSFLKDLREAHKKGLSKQTALAALTTIPAQILGNKELGQLSKNNIASLVITDGPLFEDNTQIAETWVAGQVYAVNGLPKLLSGNYQLSDDKKNYLFKLQNEGGKIKLTASDEKDKRKYSLKASGNFMSLTIKEDENESEYFGVIKDRTLIAINDSAWQLTRLADTDNQEIKEKSESVVEFPSIPKPFSPYGLAEIKSNNSYLIKNATVWTNEEQGILAETDVLVINGKINSLGKNLRAGKNTITIDGTGKHLTSGIIDEHAHIALLSVNDIAVNSSMVRMKDVINSHDINIFRNLAGGVTAAQLLHGSANPIGGQSALVKLRWGVDKPEDMLIEGADGFIKFALGENVKRSSSNESIRYPLTRMGVEQVFRDAFTQAKAYEKAWDDYNKLSASTKKKTTPPRKDLAMEATLEVVNQDRFVSCHSYVQSEINMLMHVADDFGFNINTFTHILEGYKVADKMKAHGVGGSTFSDWWAYKWEVNYAIPYNAALMNKAGVVTAINSDSAEMSRRLNQEAAKSIKYGGLNETEAWKLVTLNPAKLLHLEGRMGSVKAGKDADLVLWSDHPLSIYAMAEKTMVDGVIYFDRDTLAQTEQTIADERQRLIDLSKNSTGEKSPFKSKPQKTFECESISGYHEFDQLFYTGAHL